MAARGSRNRRAVASRGALLLGAVLVAAGLLEIGLRIAGVASEGITFRHIGVEGLPEGTVRDARMLWRLAPRGGLDPIDALGIRGVPPPGPPEGRDLRVLCTGDSCTYGIHLPPEEAWAAVLDRRLQERHPELHVETVPAAAPGYSTFQNRTFLERHAARFAPHVTILYVGVWNDLTPTTSFSDRRYAEAAERLDRHPFWSLRLGRLLWRALNPFPTADEIRRHCDEVRESRVTPATRVSLEEFRENIAAMVELARATGPVVGILPPVRSAAEVLPWSGSYRDRMAGTYAELGVPVVDGNAVLAAWSAKHDPGGIRKAELFLDAIHPGPLGQALLAEAVAPVVEDVAGARMRELGSRPCPPAPEVLSVEPKTLPAGRGATLAIRGRGFAGGAGPYRLLVNGRPAPAPRIAGDGSLLVALDQDFLRPPGPLALTLRSRSGLVPAGPAPEVLPWRTEVSVPGDSGARRLRVAVDAEGPLLVLAWFAREAAPEGRRTRWGPFRLSALRGAHPDAAFENPHGFPDLDLPLVHFLRDAPGPAPLAGEIDFPESLASPPEGRIQCQILVRWGKRSEDAWLSDVIPVRLP